MLLVWIQAVLVLSIKQFGRNITAVIQTNKTIAFLHVAAKSRYYVEAGMLTPTALSFAATYAFFSAAPLSLTSAHSNHGTERTVR